MREKGKFYNFLQIAEIKAFSKECQLIGRVSIGWRPGEALPIIAAQFTANIAAYTIAGNLLSAGILNTK